MKTEGGLIVGTHGHTTVSSVQTNAIKLIKAGQHEQAKELLEKTLRNYQFNEPILFMLCGEVNLTLGYLIISEQMFIKCLAFQGYEARALKNLGDLSTL